MKKVDELIQQFDDRQKETNEEKEKIKMAQEQLIEAKNKILENLVDQPSPMLSGRNSKSDSDMELSPDNR